jgi:hypothetical protein
MKDELNFTFPDDPGTRRDIAIMKVDLEAIHERLARLPTRMELARTALGIIFCSATLVIIWIELFWRHCL